MERRGNVQRGLAQVHGAIIYLQNSLLMEQQRHKSPQLEMQQVADTGGKNKKVVLGNNKLWILGRGVDYLISARP